MKYQKCVEKIVVEENQWKHKGGNEIQLSVYFKPHIFRYCPKYVEIRAMIDGCIEIYGVEEVEKKLNLIIGGVKQNGKSNV